MSETTKTVVKKPQDRKPKQDEPILITVSGVELTVPRDVMDDIELIDDINSVDSGNMLAMPGLLRRVFGDQYASLIEAIRDPETGKASMTKGADAIKQVFEAVPN